LTPYIPALLFSTINRSLIGADEADFQLETVAQDLENPWSLAFLPDGSSRNFAGRMEFNREGNLYVAVGDRGEMGRAQDTADDRK